MDLKVVFFLLLIFPLLDLSAKDDSICGTPLHYQVLSSNEPTEGFFWIAGNKKYDVYYKGADLILEQRKSNTLWLIPGSSYNLHPNYDIEIDSVFFQNTSENNEKELVIKYSQYRLRPENSGKSKCLLVIDIRDKIALLNITLYDHRLEMDENGKLLEYLYESDVKLYHDRIVVSTTDDSDINDARTQLDDGVYVRKGHCYISHE